MLTKRITSQNFRSNASLVNKSYFERKNRRELKPLYNEETRGRSHDFRITSRYSSHSSSLTRNLSNECPNILKVRAEFRNTRKIKLNTSKNPTKQTGKPPKPKPMVKTNTEPNLPSLPQNSDRYQELERAILTNCVSVRNKKSPSFRFQPQKPGIPKPVTKTFRRNRHFAPKQPKPLAPAPRIEPQTHNKFYYSLTVRECELEEYYQEVKDLSESFSSFFE